MALLKKWWDKITGKEEYVDVELPPENNSKRIALFEEAKKFQDSYAIMTDEKNVPILTTPISIIKCTEEELKTLHKDLCEAADGQTEFGALYYIKREHADTETVLNNLSNENMPLSRVMAENTIWLNQHFKDNLMNKRKIKEVIEGQRKRIKKTE